MTKVLISEVGPRDGLQMAKSIMATTDKYAWIHALYDAGLREIEVASFVPPKLLPQMADAADVVAYARTLDGLHVTALAPNLKGAQNALMAGVHKITLPISVSEPHAWANIRKTHAQILDEVGEIIAWRNTHFPDVSIEAGMTTAFGCTIQGNVSENDVLNLSERMVRLGVDELGLADTSGYAHPAQVKRLFGLMQQNFGAEKVDSVHLHNTRGLGLANAYAAYEAGARTIDCSQSGLGGCPFAPGASGNIVTEDAVFMFESMGVDTGIDLSKLLQARDILARSIPNEPLYGYLADAGLPKDWVYARSQHSQSK